MIRFQVRRRAVFSRLPMIAVETRHFEAQALPNPYVRLGAYDLAIERSGILISTPRRTFVWHWPEAPRVIRHDPRA